MLFILFADVNFSWYIIFQQVCFNINVGTNSSTINITFSWFLCFKVICSSNANIFLPWLSSSVQEITNNFVLTAFFMVIVPIPKFILTQKLCHHQHFADKFNDSSLGRERVQQFFFFATVRKVFTQCAFYFCYCHAMNSYLIQQLIFILFIFIAVCIYLLIRLMLFIIFLELNFFKLIFKTFS